MSQAIHWINYCKITHPGSAVMLFNSIGYISYVYDFHLFLTFDICRILEGLMMN